VSVSSEEVLNHCEELSFLDGFGDEVVASGFFGFLLLDYFSGNQLSG